MPHHKSLAVWLILGLLTAALPGASAQSDEIVQTGARVIFAVDSEAGTVTAVIGASYEGEAEDFTWLFAVPGEVLSVEFGDSDWFDVVEHSTRVWVSAPPLYCSINGRWCGADGGYHRLFDEPVPVSYEIFSAGDMVRLVEQIQEHGYEVTEEIESIITSYVEQGSSLVGVHFQGCTTEDCQHYHLEPNISPLVVTYKSDNPTFPIQLIAPHAKDPLPIRVWIFADTQYAPENWAHPVIDFSDMPVLEHMVVTALEDHEDDEIFCSVIARSPFWAYPELWIDLPNVNNGQASITEYAGSSDIVVHERYPFVNELASRYPYLTSLYAEISPIHMTLDSSFVPAPGAADVSNDVDLAEWIEPLDYWGCTTSDLTEDKYQYLVHPEARHTLFIFTLWYSDTISGIPYPEGWVATSQALKEYSSAEEIWPTYAIFTITPEGQNGDDGPMIWVTAKFPDDLNDFLGEHYEFHAFNFCSTFSRGHAFQAHGRRGYVHVVGWQHLSHIIEVSVPADDFDQYADMIKHLTLSMGCRQF